MEGLDPAGSFAADGARVPLGRRAGAARAHRRDLGGRARPRVARADRAARSDPQLLRHRRRRPGARDRPARRLDADRGPVSRRPDRREGPRPDRRDPHDLLLARLRELRPGLRQRGRPSNPRGRLRHRRQDEHTGVRHRRVHGVGAQRRDPEPVEHRAHPGRFERRGRCRPRGRARPRRARDRRRRLRSHPGVVLRAVRAQALARPRLQRAVRGLRGSLDVRAAHPHGRGRRAPARRTRRVRAGRSVVGAASRPAVRDRDARSPTSSSRGRDVVSADRPPGRSGVRRRGDVGGRAPRRARARRSRRDPAVARARALRHVHRGVAGRPRASPDRRRLAADATQPRARRGRAHGVRRRLRTQRRRAPDARPPDRLVLERRGRRAHADARAAARSDRLAGRRRGRDPTAPAQHGVHAVHRDREPHRPARDVAPAPLDGDGTARSASRRSARPPGTRFSSPLPPSSRPRVRGPTGGRPSPSSGIAIRIS